MLSSHYTEPRWIIDSEVDSLIGQMVDYMTQIGHKSYQLALDKFAAVFEALDNDIQHVSGALAFRRGDGSIEVRCSLPRSNRWTYKWEDVDGSILVYRTMVLWTFKGWLRRRTRGTIRKVCLPRVPNSRKNWTRTV
jgi:hypothetical protein